MGWPFKSLSEDSVDAVTHTWTVLFLLVLALIALLTPASRPPSTQDTLPQYNASCWCPPFFEKSHEDYTNAVCSESLGAYVRGFQHQHATIRPLSFKKGYPDYDDEMKKDDSENARNANSSDGGKPDVTSPMTTMTSPAVVLFLLALCLRLPEMVWAILSGCVGGVNLDQSLLTASRGDAMDEDGRGRLYAGLVKGFQDRTRPKSSAVMYLSIKVLTIIILVIEIIVVAVLLTPDSSPEIVSLEGPVHVCSIQANTTKGLKSYDLQCFFTEVAGSKFSISLCDIFYTVVMCALVAMVMTNVLNTITWFWLLCGQRSLEALGLPKTASIDLVLLIQLAKRNLSVGVVSGLVGVAKNLVSVGTVDANETVLGNGEGIPPVDADKATDNKDGGNVQSKSDEAAVSYVKSDETAQVIA